MAAAGRVDLDDRHAVLLDAVCILAREEVALDDGHLELVLELLHRLFEHRRLAGSRRAHEIDDVDILLREQCLILSRHAVILSQDILHDLYLSHLIHLQIFNLHLASRYRLEDAVLALRAPEIVVLDVEFLPALRAAADERHVLDLGDHVK